MEGFFILLLLSTIYRTFGVDNRIQKKGKHTQRRNDMLKGLEYETVFEKMVMAFAAAVMLVVGLILLMGIQVATCNPAVLTLGVVIVTILLAVGSVI